MYKEPLEIAVLCVARLQSRRCPNKMLRPFCGSTLIEICLEKLAALDGHPIYFGAFEGELLKLAEKYSSITVLERTRRAAEEHSDVRVIMEVLRQISSPWIFWVNPCHPLLELKTIECALQCFAGQPGSAMTSVISRKGWFYGQSGHALNKFGAGDTVRAEPIYEVAHAFHAYRRECLIAHGFPWIQEQEDPNLYVLPEEEALDVDTELDFEVVEHVYRSRKADR